MMNEEDIPSGNGIYIGPNAKGVMLNNVKSYSNKRSGIHIHKDAVVEINVAEMFDNGLDGITVSDGKEYNLVTILDEIFGRIDDFGLKPELRAELESELSTIRTQLSSPKPKKVIITESLKSVRSIIEGVAGSAVYAGIVHGLGILINA